MTLKENLRRAPKMISMWVGTGAILFSTLPADQQAAILAVIGLGPQHATAVIGVLFMLARLLPQKNLS